MRRIHCFDAHPKPHCTLPEPESKTEYISLCCDQSIKMQTWHVYFSWKIYCWQVWFIVCWLHINIDFMSTPYGNISGIFPNKFQLISSMNKYKMSIIFVGGNYSFLKYLQWLLNESSVELWHREIVASYKIMWMYIICHAHQAMLVAFISAISRTSCM